MHIISTMLCNTVCIIFTLYYNTVIKKKNSERMNDKDAVNRKQKKS